MGVSTQPNNYPERDQKSESLLTEQFSMLSGPHTANGAIVRTHNDYWSTASSR